MITGSIEKRIAAYESVYAIPFRLGHADGSFSANAEEKAIMLKDMFLDLGLAAHVILCRVSVTDLGLPSEIAKLAPFKHIGHAFVQVFIPEAGQTIDIDLTRQNVKWDGIAPIPLAVKLAFTQSREISARNLLDREKLGPAEERQIYYEMDRTFGPFISAVNTWVAQQAPHA